MERLMLLDGYGLVYRGYFALPPLTTSKGELVNGVFGFASIVLRGPATSSRTTSRSRSTSRARPSATSSTPSTRRPGPRMPDDLRDQFPKVREVVKALRIPVYEMPGYEADDVIGTITSSSTRATDLETTIVTVDLDMLQLVTPRVRLMTTRSGRREHGHLRRREDRRALRAPAGPDGRLQGAQGRPDRQHPGRARRRREDRGQADPRVRRPRLAARAARRGDARQARRQAARARRPDPDGPGPLDDRPRPADRVRPGGGPPRRLRPRHGRPAVPRVRVPDAHRAPAADGRRVRRRSGREPARRRRERLRPGGARRRHGPRAGVPGRAIGPRDRTAASCSSASTSTRSRSGGASSVDRPPGPTREPPTRHVRTARRRRRRPADRAGGRDRRPGPDRGPRPRTRIAELEPWLAAQPAVGVALLADDPRPRRGTPLALAVAGTDGRVVAAEGAEAADALRHLLDRLGTPLVGHEVKPVLVARLRRGPGASPPRRSRSTPRSRPTS